MQPAELAKKMIITICVLTLAAIAGSVIYYRSLSCLPFIAGVLLGSAVGVFKVFLLKRAVDKSIEMEQKNGANYARLQHLLRLLLTGTVLVLGAVVPVISLWGVIAGVVAYQISVYTLKFTAKL